MGVQEALENLKESMVMLTEGLHYIAILNKKYYDSLVKEGFSEHDALELVKVQGFKLNQEASNV